MDLRKPSSVNAILGGCITVLLLCRPTLGVIIHPVDEGAIFDAPAPAVVGAWGSTGSCVAIAPNYVVTAKHVSTTTNGAAVHIAGKTYYATNTVDHDSADLRVARIVTANNAPANLTQYVSPYMGDGELLFENMVIGGVGKVRGESLMSEGVVYGYRWADNTTGEVRFGVNRVDSIAPNVTMSLIRADFDGPYDMDNLEGESIPAGGDSGGGWFARENDQWWLMGISRSVSNNGPEAWFRDPADPTTPDADTTLALRVSSYTEWLFQNISLGRILEGDLNLDGTVDGADAAILQSNYGSDQSTLLWTDGDLTGDGKVTFNDAWLLLQNYGATSAPIPDVPEPTTAMLLISAAAMLLRRRR